MNCLQQFHPVTKKWSGFIVYATKFRVGTDGYIITLPNLLMEEISTPPLLDIRQTFKKGQKDSNEVKLSIISRRVGTMALFSDNVTKGTTQMRKRRAKDIS